MLNKTQLQTNNTALDGYIARINAAKDVAASLPEAGSGGGSGGGLETVTISVSCTVEPGTEICYIDGSLTYIRTPVVSYTEYNVLKGSILAMLAYPANTLDKCTYIDGYGPCRAFLVTG